MMPLGVVWVGDVLKRTTSACYPSSPLLRPAAGEREWLGRLVAHLRPGIASVLCVSPGLDRPEEATRSPSPSSSSSLRREESGTACEPEFQGPGGRCLTAGR